MPSAGSAALLEPCSLLCRFGDNDTFVETDPAKLARCASDGYALDSTNRTYGAFMDDLCATVINQPGEPCYAGPAIAGNELHQRGCISQPEWQSVALSSSHASPQWSSSPAARQRSVVSASHADLKLGSHFSTQLEELQRSAIVNS